MVRMPGIKPARDRASDIKKKVPRPWRRLTGTARMLPTILIIGAQRAGTTSLFHYLTAHPSIGGSTPKEVHFFDVNYPKGLLWYRSHFPLAIGWPSTDGVAKTPLALEASPYYLFHPHAPRRIAQTLPGARVIALLRDPVDRALSHYHHKVRTGREHLTFEEAVDQEEVRLAGETERLLKDPEYYSGEHQHHSYLLRGIYVDQLQRWVECFPWEQMLVLNSADLFSQPAEVVRRVVQFVGLPTDGLPTLYPQHNSLSYEDLRPKVRQRLKDYFRPHNQRLFDYLGADFGWNS